jgi:hypothetical protein
MRADDPMTLGKLVKTCFFLFIMSVNWPFFRKCYPAKTKSGLPHDLLFKRMGKRELEELPDSGENYHALHSIIWDGGPFKDKGVFKLAVVYESVDAQLLVNKDRKPNQRMVRRAYKEEYF